MLKAELERESMKKKNNNNKNKTKLTASALGASVLHHSDWTIHGVLDELTHHNGYVVAGCSLALLLLIDLFFKSHD